MFSRRLISSPFFLNNLFDHFTPPQAMFSFTEINELFLIFCLIQNFAILLSFTFFILIKWLFLPLLLILIFSNINFFRSQLSQKVIQKESLTLLHTYLQEGTPGSSFLVRSYETNTFSHYNGFHYIVRGVGLIATLNLVTLVTGAYNLWSMITFALFMSLGLWSYTLILSFINVGAVAQANKQNVLNFFANWLPSGTPLVLAPFIVGIELISYVIRGFSLGIRICGNITVGHLILFMLNGLLMAQLSGTLATATIITFSIITLGYFTLFFMELCVSFLQGYIFIILSFNFLQETEAIH